jgi:hypothetical protein
LLANANYTLVLLGIGAMTRALFLYFIGNPGLALDVDMKPIEDQSPGRRLAPAQGLKVIDHTVHTTHE